MTLEALAETGHEFNTPRVSVIVDGQTFEETSGLFGQVTVDRAIDGADRFSLSIATRFIHEDAEFIDFDWTDFDVGAPIEIAMGYGATLTPILVGSITEHAVDFPDSGAPSISVSGYGRYHELTTDRVRDQWRDTTDSEIVETIAAEYGFQADVDRTEVHHDTVENDQESDAIFIADKLAGRNDTGTGPFEVFARLDDLVFRAPRDFNEPQLELKYGESLQSFSPERTEARAPARVEVRNWDPSKKEDIVGVAESNDGSGTRVVRRPVWSAEEAESIAHAILHREENERLSGSGTTIGLPDIEIGEPIELTGLGERFSGTYYVESVTHTFGGNGYVTDFSVREARGEGRS